MALIGPVMMAADRLTIHDQLAFPEAPDEYPEDKRADDRENEPEKSQECHAVSP